MLMHVNERGVPEMQAFEWLEPVELPLPETLNMLSAQWRDRRARRHVGDLRTVLGLGALHADAEWWSDESLVSRVLTGAEKVGITEAPKVPSAGESAEASKPATKKRKQVAGKSRTKGKQEL